MLKNTKQSTLYQLWLDSMLQTARQVCQQCVDPNRNEAALDLDNPLNSGCRCEPIAELLERAADIEEDIKLIKRERTIAGRSSSG